MLNILEASQLADQKLVEHCDALGIPEANRPVLLLDTPLRLPDGYRFPYEYDFNGDRLRDFLLIIFVDDNKNAIIEWDDSERHKQKLDWLKKSQRQGAVPHPDFPSKSAIQAILNQHEKLSLDTVERVWDVNQEQEIQLFLRLGILVNGKRYEINIPDDDLVALNDKFNDIEQEGARKWRSAGTDHTANGASIGRISFENDPSRIVVNLSDLRAIIEVEKKYLYSQWVIWSCVAQTTEFLENLGYRGMGVNRVGFEFKATTQRVSFQEKFIPRIVIPQEGGWGEDPSIILHELGHAVWWLLFTRNPVQIPRTDRNFHILAGIQEGFSDYFSATNMDGNGKNTPVKIGGWLTENVPGDLLPREISTDFLPASLTEQSEVHAIGHRWANFLWDFRERVGKGDADRVILRAHVRPQLEDSEHPDPVAAYFEAVKKASEKVNAFDQWDDLKRKHIDPP